MKRWYIILAAALLLTLAFAACGGGDAKSTPELQIYTIRLEVVDEENLPVNGVNVTGGDIFGSTAQGGVLERSMVDEGQFQRHLDVTYGVEKSGCIVDQQQVRIDETSEGFATITLPLACSEPLVRLGRSAGALLFDGENIWVANSTENTVTKVALDGTVLGTFPVGHGIARLAFDGENIWVAAIRASVTKLDRNGRHLGTFHIRMTDFENFQDAITDLAFDGDGIWVSHRTGKVTKLALDGTELWTTPRWPGVTNQLIFTGNRMVRMESAAGFREFLRTFDLDGNHLQYSELGGGQSSFYETVGSIRDATFGGDGIWVATSCGVAKISMDGELVLGPFDTSCGYTKNLIFDGEYIWVLDSTALVRLSSDGQGLDTFAVGLCSADLVSDGESLWVTSNGADCGSGALWKITPD